MKYIGTLLIALPLLIVSCKKDHDGDQPPAGEDYGCIERIFIKKNEHTINSADVPTVDKLFSDNGINNSNFRYFRHRLVTQQNQSTSYDKYDYIYVDQFAKDLRVFHAVGIFSFKNDILYYAEPNPIDVSELDTISRCTLPRLRKLFLYDLEKYYSRQTNYSDTCFNAEFGFLKIHGSREEGDKFIKAWRVTTKNRPLYPEGYYDGEGNKILFSSGIFAI
ncbi:MAG TPA: hypothetical protein VF008_01200 [Niastella sp.]